VPFSCCLELKTMWSFSREARGEALGSAFWVLEA
jgi:hypothetical protein